MQQPAAALIAAALAGGALGFLRYNFNRPNFHGRRLGLILWDSPWLEWGNWLVKALLSPLCCCLT